MPFKKKSFFERTCHPYYIASPAFRQTSGGVRALHYFCHALNESGYEAYIATEPGGTSPHLRTPELTQDIVKRHKSSGCVPIGVYPEVAHGNILGLSVIARWILNKPGHLGGGTSYEKGEILFYWDEWMIDSSIVADKLNIPIIDRRIFNDRGAPAKRKGYCYYANKYFKRGQSIGPALSGNGTSLCLDIPRSPQEIANILRASEAFYCYEPSSLVLEALACGCPVGLVDTPYLDEFEWKKNPIFRIKESEIGKIKLPEVDAVKAEEYFQGIDTQAWLHIENFIEKTQAAADAQAEHQQTPECRLQEAVTAFRSNELETAMTGLAPLLDEQPQNPLPPAYLAFICARQGLVEEAEEFIGKAFEIAPGRADLKAGLGESFLSAGNPDQAARFLQEAIAEQPDLLAAYPALARSLQLTGRDEKAVALLQGAATIPSTAQTNIRNTLLEILVERGDIDTFADVCCRYSRSFADDLLAASTLARIDTTGEHLVEALLAAQARLSTVLEKKDYAPPANAITTRSIPLRIAFLISDFTRERQQGRLAPLLRHLPPERFMTVLLINDPQASENEHAQFCSLIADQTLLISGQDDAQVLEQLATLAPDVLIDLDSYGPAERLVVLAQAQAPFKLLWGESPLPPLTPEWLPVRGAFLADDTSPPGLNLPKLGEYLELPELPVTQSARQDKGHTRFACLTPAIRIRRETWQLFAEVLRTTAGSQLTLNLHGLGDQARHFITSQFENTGIAATRLRFIHARTPEALCQLWQEADIGLAPPVDAGEMALPSCLWMGKPYIALATALPWGQRPAALLAAAGAGEWLANTSEEYVALAERAPPAANPSFREALRKKGLTDPADFAHGFDAAITALIAGRQA